MPQSPQNTPEVSQEGPGKSLYPVPSEKDILPTEPEAVPGCQGSDPKAPDNNKSAPTKSGLPATSLKALPSAGPPREVPTFGTGRALPGSAPDILSPSAPLLCQNCRRKAPPP